ncbi:MAG: hypothetical protein RLY86_142 [Pseudomonadota bacterium]
MKDDLRPKRPRGRPRLHADDAERKAAHRAAKGKRDTRGEMALFLWEHPTEGFTIQVIDRLLDRVPDRDLVRARLLLHLVETR